MPAPTKKLMNFQSACDRLKEAVLLYQKDRSNDIVRDGLIQRFEFTYELAWKATKECLEEIGIADVNSPKMVFREAYAQGWLHDEERWLQILRDRNNSTHLYSEDVAQAIADRVVADHLHGFQELLSHLRE